MEKPINQAPLEIGVDWTEGRDQVVYRCACGFECGDAIAMEQHVTAHGATAVTFTPENRAS